MGAAWLKADDTRHNIYYKHDPYSKYVVEWVFIVCNTLWSVNVVFSIASTLPCATKLDAIHTVSGILVTLILKRHKNNFK